MQDILEEIRGYLATDLGSKCNEYYAGRIQYPPLNLLPVCNVYADYTEHKASSTGMDRSVHHVKVEVVTSLHAQDSTAGIESTSIAPMQKDIIEIMEKRTNGMPDSTSILGSLRKRIAGTNYLFNGEIVINYDSEIKDNITYFRATLSIVVTRTEIIRTS